MKRLDIKMKIIDLIKDSGLASAELQSCFRADESTFHDVLNELVKDGVVLYTESNTLVYAFAD